MGKNLNNGNLVTRPQKLAFYKLPTGAYQRMEGFTDLSYSQNPKEYSRQYVDEDFERTDIVGYAPSISYSFDRYTGNRVLSDIVKITENEFVGDLMKRTIVTVDITDEVTDGYGNAKMRDYAVIPDSSGDSTDCLTYSGTFKARGGLCDCVATSDDDWQTISVTPHVSESTSANIFVTGDGVRGTISNSSGGTHIQGDITKNTSVAIEIISSFVGASITMHRITNGFPIKIASGKGVLTSEGNTVSSDVTYSVAVEAGGKSTYYTIDLTAVD
ncbi:MAG: hypothetical protein K2J08_06210 [Ruminococcus sp.]|nr:hypothetical protein [Ruminococcus sp.]